VFKKMLFVMMFLMLVGMLWGACYTYRHKSIGNADHIWSLEWWNPATLTWVRKVPAPATVPPGNIYDRLMSAGGRYVPWEKLYDMPVARWTSWHRTADSRFAPCQPEPDTCYYRYTLWQFSIPDTITRATMWLSVDDVVTAIDMRNLRTGVVTGVPMPVAGFSGFTQLHRLDLTDFFRDDLTPDAYQMEIYVTDYLPNYTGLIFYLSFDEDDEVATYTYNLNSPSSYLSFPFYYEGGAIAPTIATIFPTATFVQWTVNGITSRYPAGLVPLDGAFGDTIRTYTVRIDFPAAVTYNVDGTSIWEKRYLDIKNGDELWFSTVDCTIPWPNMNSPDDFVNGTVTQNNTGHLRYWPPTCPTSSVIPQNGHYSNPNITSLPYHLDIICPDMDCGSPAPGVSNERISYPTSEETWARIHSVMALVHVPDSSEIKAYLDSLDSLVKFYSSDTTDSFRSSPKKTIEVPKSIELNVYPNPFNAVVSIVLSLPNEKIIHISIYDLKGKLVENLYNGQLPTGNHVFTWDGSAALDEESTSGVFFVKALIDEEVITKKIQLIK